MGGDKTSATVPLTFKPFFLSTYVFVCFIFCWWWYYLSIRNRYLFTMFSILKYNKKVVSLSSMDPLPELMRRMQIKFQALHRWLLRSCTALYFPFKKTRDWKFGYCMKLGHFVCKDTGKTHFQILQCSVSLKIFKYYSEVLAWTFSNITVQC